MRTLKDILDNVETVDFPLSLNALELNRILSPKMDKYVYTEEERKVLFITFVPDPIESMWKGIEDGNTYCPDFSNIDIRVFVKKCPILLDDKKTSYAYIGSGKYRDEGVVETYYDTIKILPSDTARLDTGIDRRTCVALFADELPEYIVKNLILSGLNSFIGEVQKLIEESDNMVVWSRVFRNAYRDICSYSMHEFKEFLLKDGIESDCMDLARMDLSCMDLIFAYDSDSEVQYDVETSDENDIQYVLQHSLSKKVSLTTICCFPEDFIISWEDYGTDGIPEKIVPCFREFVFEKSFLPNGDAMWFYMEDGVIKGYTEHGSTHIFEKFDKGEAIIYDNDCNCLACTDVEAEAVKEAMSQKYLSEALLLDTYRKKMTSALAKAEELFLKYCLNDLPKYEE